MSPRRWDSSDPPGVYTAYYSNDGYRVARVRVLIKRGHETRWMLTAPDGRNVLLGKRATFSSVEHAIAALAKAAT